MAGGPLKPKPGLSGPPVALEASAMQPTYARAGFVEDSSPAAREPSPL